MTLATPKLDVSLDDLVAQGKTRKSDGEPREARARRRGRGRDRRRPGETESQRRRRRRKTKAVEERVPQGGDADHAPKPTPTESKLDMTLEDLTLKSRTQARTKRVRRSKGSEKVQKPFTKIINSRRRRGRGAAAAAAPTDAIVAAPMLYAAAAETAASGRKRKRRRESTWAVEKWESWQDWRQPDWGGRRADWYSGGNGGGRGGWSQAATGRWGSGWAMDRSRSRSMRRRNDVGWHTIESQDRRQPRTRPRFSPPVQRIHSSEPRGVPGFGYNDRTVESAPDRWQPSPSPVRRVSARVAARRTRVTGCRIKITNMPLDLLAKDVANAFGTVGVVLGVDMPCKGEAILKFRTADEARDAVDSYNGGDMNGSRIQVKQL